MKHPGYLTKKQDMYLLNDHALGFDENFKNSFLDTIHNPAKVMIEYSPTPELIESYPHLDFIFNYDYKISVFDQLKDYKIHPDVQIKNLVCCFNGTYHINRVLATAVLHKHRLFDPSYSTKNFAYTADTVINYLQHYVGSQSNFYNKLFVDDNTDFYSNLYQTDTGDFNAGVTRLDHTCNIYNMEKRVTSSFVNLVTETAGESYLPFVTEKFLYSVLTRGIWIAFAQPGYHDHLNSVYGFKMYNNIFDYSFDKIQNPVNRLVEIIKQLTLFSNLSDSDLQDLRHLESETIEFNYDHYHSGIYKKVLQNAHNQNFLHSVC